MLRPKIDDARAIVVIDASNICCANHERYSDSLVFFVGLKISEMVQKKKM